MRLLIKIGLVPSEPESLPRVEARAEGDGAVGRWLTANLDIRSLLAMLTLAATLIGGWVELKVEQRDQRADIADLQGRLSRLNTRVTEGSVSRTSYEHDTNGIQFILNGLANQQQQIYSLLVDNALQHSRKDLP